VADVILLFWVRNFWF